MSEQAGRLEVEVVANLRGFAEKLREGVDRAAEGVEAKIGVKIDHHLLRERLQVAVKEASKGVEAKIKVKLDKESLRNELSKLETELAGRGTVELKTHVENADLETLKTIEEAQLEADRHPVEIKVKEDRTFLGRFKAWFAQVRKDAATHFDAGLSGASGKDGGGGLFSNLLGDWKKGFEFLGKLKLPAMASLAQPAIAGLNALGSSLFTFAAGAAQASQSAAALPGLLGGLLQGFAGFKLATANVGNAISTAVQLADKKAAGFALSQEEMLQLQLAFRKLSPAAAGAARSIYELVGPFRQMRKAVQQSFFSQFVGDIKPLAGSLLPLLRDGFTQTGAALGNMVHQAALWMRTAQFRADFAQGMRQNNYTLQSYGIATGHLAKAMVNLYIASWPLVKLYDDWLKKFTAHIEAVSAADRANGRLSNTLLRAGHRMGQVLRILKYFFGALVQIGHVALGVDDSLGKGGLFASLERIAKGFDDWAHSAKGITKISGYFRDMNPLAKELGTWIRVIADGFFNTGDQNASGLTKNLRDLRTALAPLAGGFLKDFSSQVGPELIGMVSSIARAANAIGSGKTPALIGFLKDLVGAMKGFFDFFAQHKTTSQVLGYVIAALLGFKIFKAGARYTGLLSLATALGKVLGVLGALKRLGPRGLLSALSDIGKAKLGFGGALFGGVAGRAIRDVERAAKGIRVYWLTPMPVEMIGSVGKLGKGASAADALSQLGGGKGGAAQEAEKVAEKQKGRLGRLLERVGGSRLGRLVSRFGGARVAATLGGAGALLGRTVGGAGRFLRGRLGRVGGDAGFLDLAAFGGRRGGRLLSHLTRPFEAFGSKIGSLGRLFGRSGGLLGKGVKLLGKGGIGGIVAGLGADWLAGKLHNGKRGWRDAAGGALSGAATGASIGALVGSVIPGLGTVVGGAAGGVIGGVVGAVKSSNMPKLLKGLGKDIGDAVRSGFGDAKTAASSALSSISSVAGHAFGVVKNAASDAWTTAGNLASGAWDGYKTIVKTQLSTVGHLASAGWGVVSSAASDAWTGTKRYVEDGVNTARTTVGNGLSVVGHAASSAWNSVSSATSSAWSSAKQTVSDGVSTIGSTIGGLGSAVGSGVSKGASALSQAGHDIMQYLANGITKASKGFGGWLQGAVKGLTGAAGALAGSLTDGLNWLGGVSFFAKGGRPKPGAPAIVGEKGPELWVPDQAGTILTADRTRRYLTQLRRGRAGQLASELVTAGAGGGATFHEGAIVVHNPAPEPASTSISTRMRTINQMGLFGGTPA